MLRDVGFQLAQRHHENLIALAAAATIPVTIYGLMTIAGVALSMANGESGKEAFATMLKSLPRVLDPRDATGGRILGKRLSSQEYRTKYDLES